jgi:hypothetical protein
MARNWLFEENVATVTLVTIDYNFQEVFENVSPEQSKTVWEFFPPYLHHDFFLKTFHGCILPHANASAKFPFLPFHMSLSAYNNSY